MHINKFKEGIDNIYSKKNSSFAFKTHLGKFPSQPQFKFIKAKFMWNRIIISSPTQKKKKIEKEQKKQISKRFMLLANLDLYTFLLLLYNNFSFLRRKCFLSKSLRSYVYSIFSIVLVIFCYNILGVLL